MSEPRFCIVLNPLGTRWTCATCGQRFDLNAFQICVADAEFLPICDRCELRHAPELSALLAIAYDECPGIELRAMANGATPP